VHTAAAASRSELWDFFLKAATMRRHDSGLKFRTPRFTASVPAEVPLVTVATASTFKLSSCSKFQVDLIDLTYGPNLVVRPAEVRGVGRAADAFEVLVGTQAVALAGSSSCQWPWFSVRSESLAAPQAGRARRRDLGWPGRRAAGSRMDAGTSGTPGPRAADSDGGNGTTVAP
jgi:hypothetical protein